MKNGTCIKKIRKNKGYSQKYVAENILSQSSYSKFEANLSDIHSTSYIQILQKLHITSEETDYISNSFKQKKDQKLISKFFSLPFNEVSKLEEIIIEINTTLNDIDNIILKDIRIICEALISLHTKEDINIARKIVEPVWNRLSKHNQWYLSDIRLINTILYLFPNDSALEVTKNVLHRLELYDGFQDSQKLMITFKINLSLLLIKEGDYQKALEVLINTLQKHKKSMSYQSLAVCFTRISICNDKLGLINGIPYIEKARLLLDIYDGSELWKEIQKEYQYYNKN